ncbi:MAG: sugar transferase [Anaerolineae bacterium]|nr:sugar transferase [Anaerolineae bacterium]
MFFEPRPSRRRRPQFRISERRLLLRAGDVAATVAAVLIALFVWSLVDRRRPYTLAFILEESHWLVILPALWLLLASANDLYDLQLASSHIATLNRLLAVTLQLLVVYLIIFFLSPRDALPRLFILYYGAASFVLIAVWRLWRPYLMGWASEKRRALVVGADWGATTIIEAIEAYAPGQYQVIGIVSGDQDQGRLVAGVPVLGSGSEVLALARRYDVTELIIATPCELSGDLFQGVMDCYQQGISIVPMAILYERLTGRVPVQYVGKDWAIVLPIETASIFDPYPVLKRLLDIVMALSGLALFVPIFLVLVPAMRLDSPGPIFFRQERVGRGGRRFKVIKLRSMVPNAEQETGAVFAARNDPRITRVGRFLRRSRLDEVPQLWNVLRGEMSMIGPRPERPEFIDALTREIPFYRTRLAVQPGITGWAQVRYAYANSLEDHLIKLQYDLYYIRHRSLLLDLQIAIRTIGRMLSFAGQ